MIFDRDMILRELEKEKKRLFLAKSIKEVRRVQKRIKFLEKALSSSFFESEEEI